MLLIVHIGSNIISSNVLKKNYSRVYPFFLLCFPHLSYLTVEEARPVIQSLLTGEFSYATSQAKLLMKVQPDQNFYNES